VLDGGVAYPTLYTDTEVVAVVGHTGCGAVTAAYDVARGETERDELPPGVRADLDPLIETVVDAPVALDGEKRAVVDRLVEYNVREQVSFVAGETDAAVYGFVYDIHRRYGDEDGRAYLVAAGDGDPGDVVGDGNGMAVESVL
jgi:carbonic anhydrase